MSRGGGRGGGAVRQLLPVSPRLRTTGVKLAPIIPRRTVWAPSILWFLLSSPPPPPTPLSPFPREDWLFGVTARLVASSSADLLATRRHRRDRRDRAAVLAVRYQPFLPPSPRYIAYRIAVVVLVLVVIAVIGMNDDGRGGDQHGVHRELLAETFQSRRGLHFYQVRKSHGTYICIHVHMHIETEKEGERWSSCIISASSNSGDRHAKMRTFLRALAT